MIHLAANSSNNSGWMIVIFILVAIFFQWLAMGSHKHEIRMEVTRLKAKLLKIRWLPFHGWGDSNDTFYEVTMVLPSGRRVEAVCKCNYWHGVFWQSTPWAQELLREPPPATEAKPPFESMAEATRVISDCSRCGYGMQKGWVACPNCGTEVAG
ncbi:MAG: hypothetical protein ACO1TE_19460 [Prosthecobacter sp.]